MGDCDWFGCDGCDVDFGVCWNCGVCDDVLMVVDVFYVGFVDVLIGYYFL